MKILESVLFVALGVLLFWSTPILDVPASMLVITIMSMLGFLILVRTGIFSRFIRYVSFSLVVFNLALASLFVLGSVAMIPTWVEYVVGTPTVVIFVLVVYHQIKNELAWPKFSTK